MRAKYVTIPEYNTVPRQIYFELPDNAVIYVDGEEITPYTGEEVRESITEHINYLDGWVHHARYKGDMLPETGLFNVLVNHLEEIVQNPPEEFRKESYDEETLHSRYKVKLDFNKLKNEDGVVNMKYFDVLTYFVNRVADGHTIPIVYGVSLIHGHVREKVLANVKATDVPEKLITDIIDSQTFTHELKENITKFRTALHGRNEFSLELSQLGQTGHKLCQLPRKEEMLEELEGIIEFWELKEPTWR